MAIIVGISWQKNSEELNFTQVGGIYRDEIKPQDYLNFADITECLAASNIGQPDRGREPRFFSVE